MYIVLYRVEDPLIPGMQNTKHLLLMHPTASDCTIPCVVTTHTYKQMTKLWRQEELDVKLLEYGLTDWLHVTDTHDIQVSGDVVDNANLHCEVPGSDISLQNSSFSVNFLWFSPVYVFSYKHVTLHYTSLYSRHSESIFLLTLRDITGWRNNSKHANAYTDKSILDSNSCWKMRSDEELKINEKHVYTTLNSVIITKLFWLVEYLYWL